RTERGVRHAAQILAPAGIGPMVPGAPAPARGVVVQPRVHAAGRALPETPAMARRHGRYGRRRRAVAALPFLAKCLIRLAAATLRRRSTQRPKPLRWRLSSQAHPPHALSNPRMATLVPRP